jgi:hypothetical protein
MIRTCFQQLDLLDLLQVQRDDPVLNPAHQKLVRPLWNLHKGLHANVPFKGIVQRKLTGVESGTNR